LKAIDPDQAMSHDVFISHSAVDKRMADAACAALERVGIRCWIAPRDITPGMPWGEALIDAIQESSVFLLIYSSHANQSPQVLREVAHAAGKGLPILPLRIEDVPPCKSLEFFVSTHHWMDALSEPLDAHLDRLAGSILKLLGRAGSHSARTPEPARDLPPPVAPPAAPGSANEEPSAPRCWRAERQRVLTASPAGDIEKVICYWTNTIGMKFVLVPPGRLLRKVRVTRDGASREEEHPILTTASFYLGAHPVTVRDFARFVQATSYVTESQLDEGAWIQPERGKDWVARKDVTWQNPGFEQTDQHPVTCVSWNDATRFVQWLSELEGLLYQLPSDAQWEFACRAGTRTAYYWGDEFRPDCAWMGGNSGWRTHPVGTRLPNTGGLHDMCGNVWEWCRDWLGSAAWSGDPEGPPTGEKKLLRGASWWNKPANGRSDNHWADVPSSTTYLFGFRVLLSGG